MQQKTNEHLQIIIDTSPRMIILFDSDLKVVYGNAAAYSLFGLETQEELIADFVNLVNQYTPQFISDGKPSVSIADRLAEAVKKINIKFEAELNVEGEILNLGVEMKKIPYNDSFGIVMYVSNITDIKKLIYEAEKQRVAAVEANKAKSSFLSTMSHEIRTPMNAILGIAEIQLQNEALEPDIKEAMEKIYASGDLLLSIINDILDLSKIEAHKLELVIDKYDIASLISDTAQLNMMRIGSKEIKFELDIAENIPMRLSGDELRIKQILNNLLSNAFKYTAEGMVKLSVSVEERNTIKDEIILVIKVSDTGQGMSKEQINTIFEEYARFNQKANRTSEGTGLGMPITQSLISMMNGTIHVESEQGIGSTFIVRLPQEKADSALLGKEIADNLNLFRLQSRANLTRVQISREPMPYGSVLIIDDVDTNIYVARGLLAPYGLKIDSADNGYTAIEKIKNGNVYDIVFMDHMMPNMDGIETTKRIRSMGYDQPIVALTANAVSGQSEIFLGNGFDDFISKPIDIRRLNLILNKLIRDKQPQEVIEAARQQAASKGEQPPEPKLHPSMDPRFIEAFLHDAAKSLSVLNEISDRAVFDENDLRTYVIHTHGMKSALANMKKRDLSAIALKLEQSGRQEKISVITSETHAFLNSLHSYVDELAQKVMQLKNETIAETDEDKNYLHEKLLAIKTACEEYNEQTTEDLLTDLRKKAWSLSTTTLLGKIAEHLLHSEFNEIVNIVNNAGK